MSTAQQFTNYVPTTLASGCTNVATTITLTSAAGLPTVGNFMLRIDDAAPATTFEYVECTSIAGAVATVTRGQEGTSGIAHSAGAFVGNEPTAAMLLRAFPWGTLPGGYAVQTATINGIVTATTLTGASAAVTVSTGRRIRVSFWLSMLSTVAADVMQVNIMEGATVLQTIYQYEGGASLTQVVQGSVILTPTAAAHTYFLQALRAVGTGGVQSTVSAAQVGYILVEDIGPV